MCSEPHLRRQTPRHRARADPLAVDADPKPPPVHQRADPGALRKPPLRRAPVPPAGEGQRAAAVVQPRRGRVEKLVRRALDRRRAQHESRLLPAVQLEDLHLEVGPARRAEARRHARRVKEGVVGGPREDRAAVRGLDADRRLDREPEFATTADLRRGRRAAGWVRCPPPPTPNIQDPEGLIFTKAAPSPTEEVTARVTLCLIPI